MIYYTLIGYGDTVKRLICIKLISVSAFLHHSSCPFHIQLFRLPLREVVISREIEQILATVFSCLKSV